MIMKTKRRRRASRPKYSLAEVAKRLPLPSRDSANPPPPPPPLNLPTRLTTGKFFVGPDYHGCINTGHAPAILKSSALAKYPALSRGYVFAVGPVLFVEDAIKALMFDRVPEGQAYYERDHDRRYRVRFFKTYAAAKKEFSSLVAARVAANAQVRAEEQALRQQARSSNPEVALEAIVALADY
jgi:hypothetical protein